MNPDQWINGAPCTNSCGAFNDPLCASDSTVPCGDPNLWPLWSINVGSSNSLHLEDHNLQAYEFTSMEYSSSPQAGGVSLQTTQIPAANILSNASASKYCAFGSTPAALCATESSTGFAQLDHDDHFGTHPLLLLQPPDFSSEINLSCETAGCRSTGVHDLTKQNDDLHPLSQTIQTKRKDRESRVSDSKHCKTPSRRPREVLQLQPSRDASMDERKVNVSSKQYSSSNEGQLLRFASEEQPVQMEKTTTPTYLSINIPKNGASGSPAATKTRVKWTEDLHEQFVESVNRLGGAGKATPRKILKLMGSVGLNVYHVKSHLQKYRIERCIPESAEGKTSENSSSHLHAKIGVQMITQALHGQLEMQKHLYKQLKIQWKLQTRIEEHGRKLQEMVEQQQKTARNLIEKCRLDVALHNDEKSVSLKGCCSSLT